ncbi:TatD family hydrolase [bacterium]|nr:TatD family hydrolase [bacterium]
MWIDAHSHLADPLWAERVPGLLARARAAGIGAWIQGGLNPSDWDLQLQLRKQEGEGILPCFGLHPWWIADATQAQIDSALESLHKQLSQAVAIGELGLDHLPRYSQGDARVRQLRALDAQLKIARESGKPLVIHCVDAHEPMLQALKAHGPFPQRGIVHAFSGAIEVARRYIGLGFGISVGAAVTRPGYRKLKEALPLIPAESLVVETDTGEPESLVAIAQAIAALRQETSTEVLDRSARILRQIFKVPTRDFSASGAATAP